MESEHDPYKDLGPLETELELHKQCVALLEKSGAETIAELLASEELCQKYQTELGNIALLQMKLDGQT